MTNRFQWVYIKDNTLELRDNGIVKVFNNERLEELLNALSEENEQLKKELKALQKKYNDFSEMTDKRLKEMFKMTEKRFEVTFNDSDFHLKDNETGEELKLVDEKVCYDYVADRWNALHKENEYLHKYNTKLQKQPLLFDVQTIPDTMEIIEANNQLEKENEQLKAQLYCDDEEGVCNICKHHYLVKDDEMELGYYNSRCQKGHYECARVSLKHCEDFEKELEE